ncbi:hypothetical protein ACP0HM_30850 [Escherichia coli]
MKKAICTRRWNWRKRAVLPVVATNDVRFIDSSDFDAHEIPRRDPRRLYPRRS